MMSAWAMGALGGAAAAAGVRVSLPDEEDADAWAAHCAPAGVRVIDSAPDLTLVAAGQQWRVLGGTWEERVEAPTSDAAREDLCWLLRSLASEVRAHGEGMGFLRIRLEPDGPGEDLGELLIRVMDDADQEHRQLHPGDDGLFRAQLPAGSWTLRVIHPEYELIAIEEKVRSGEMLRVVYRLRRERDEVWVYGDRSLEPSRVRRLGADELARVPGTFGDPVRGLQTLPGVARQGGLDGSVVVHGAEPANTGFYIDGMPVPALFHPLIGKSVLDPNLVGAVRFYPGEVPPHLGNVAQAAVDVTLREVERGTTATLDLNLFDGGASVRHGADVWDVALGGRFGWIAGLYALASPSLRPLYADLFGRVERRAGAHRIALDALAARDRLELGEGDVGRELAGPPIDAGFVRMRLSHRWSSDRVTSHTWLAGGPALRQQRGEQLSANASTMSNGRLEDWTVLVSSAVGVQVYQSHNLEGGLQQTLSDVTTTDLSAVEAGAEPTEHTSSTADSSAHAQWRWTPGRARLTTGVRVTRFVYAGAVTWVPQPRLNPSMQLSDVLAIDGSVGWLAQLPPPEQSAPELGNPELEPVIARHLSVGTTWTPGALTVDLTAFHSETSHQIQARPVSELVGDSTGLQVVDTLVFDAVQATAVGLDALVRLHSGNLPLWGWVAASVARSTRTSQRRGTFPADHDLPAAGSAVATLELPRAWSLAGRFGVSSGRPYTATSPVFGPIAGRALLWTGPLNRHRRPVFHRLDLRVQKGFSGRRSRSAVYLDVYDVYAPSTRLPISLDPHQPDEEIDLHAPLLANLGLTVTW